MKTKAVIAAALPLAIALLGPAQCRSRAANPKLAPYLFGEKKLRHALADTRLLEDSLAALRRRYGIDPEKELARIRNNPEAWFNLVKELHGVK